MVAIDKKIGYIRKNESIRTVLMTMDNMKMAAIYDSFTFVCLCVFHVKLFKHVRHIYVNQWLQDGLGLSANHRYEKYTLMLANGKHKTYCTNLSNMSYSKHVHFFKYILCQNSYSEVIAKL